MKTLLIPIATITIVVLFAGCGTKSRTSPILSHAPSESDAMSRITASVDQAAQDLRREISERATTAALLNLSVARAGLPDTPQPTHIVEAKAISDAVFAGNEQTANALTAHDRNVMLARVVTADKERDEARKALEKERDDHAREMEELRSGIMRRVQFCVSLGLYGAAILCLLFAFLKAKAAIASGVGIVAGIRSAAMWTGLASALFSLARVIAAWWFWWACGGVLAMVAGYVGYLVWKEQRDTAKAVALKQVVSAVDAVYDDSSGEKKDELDATLFARLTDTMTSAAKQTIHAVRAAI
ncbi:hypothetical protein OpiT1DRAFT_05411 [Opitutaceae bacterium TAV1]|nr:hypothetical protein OpiT1DRAFT_05411 [Opitutaceae bacterium TAV1]